VKRGLQKPKAKVKKMKSETDPKVKKVEKRSEKAVKNVKKVKKKKDKMVKKVTVEPKDRMVRDTGGGETQSEKGGDEGPREKKWPANVAVLLGDLPSQRMPEKEEVVRRRLQERHALERRDARRLAEELQEWMRGGEEFAMGLAENHPDEEFMWT
jgi:hypothetical protein